MIEDGDRTWTTTVAGLLPRTWRDAAGMVGIVYIGILALVGLAGMLGRR